MKLASIVVVGLLSVAGTSHAADSTWLVCKGVATHTEGKVTTKHYLVANLLEHRSGGEARGLTVTLIKGNQLSRAEAIGSTVIGKQLTISTMTPDAKPAVMFKGRLELAKDLASVKLDGMIDPGGGGGPVTTPITATLTCETLDDLAIGH